MLRSYLTLALRTLRRRLGYVAASGLGLTLGLACALLVALYLQHELSYDAFHPDADRVVRINKEIEGRTDRYVLQTPTFGRAVNEQVAGVTASTAFVPNYRPTYVTTDGREFRQDAKSFFNLKAGDAFFTVLSGFRMLQGDASTALAQPSQVVLTDATARRYFGTDYGTVLGRTIEVDGVTLTVTGVMRVPTRSHLQLDFLRSYPDHGSSSATHYTYLRLAPGAGTETVEAQINAVYDRQYAATGQGFPPERITFGTERLTDIHLHTTVARPITAPTDVRYLWAFGILGGIVLLIAGLNYTNLSIVMVADRGAEVGVRKSVGADVGQVTRQLLAESVVLAGLCVVPALLLVSALRPGFNALMDTSLASVWQTPWAWGLVVGLAALIGLSASVYPALVMARKAAPRLLQGSVFGRRQNVSVRYGLVVVQFGLLIALVSGAVLVNQQLRFIQTKDLGFQRENVLQISNGNALAERTDDGAFVSPKYDQLRQRLLERTAVQNVSTLTRTPGEFWYEQTFRPATDTAQAVQAPVLRADHHVFATLGIEPAGGAYFDRPLEERTDAVLVSEAFARAAGPGSAAPEAVLDADGNRIAVNGTFKDLNFFSLRQAAAPLVIAPRSEVPYASRILVRTAPGQVAEAVGAVQQVWGDLVPDTPMQYTFLDDQVAQLYAQDRRFATLSLGLAGLAGVLAVLGLLSVAAYMARLRVKEIGIRKALGASVGSILVRLNREFVALVGVALLAGAPLAWWAVSAWLDGFAYRIAVHPLVFLGVGGGALLVAIAAVTAQSLSAARVDPAQVLRNE